MKLIRNSGNDRVVDELRKTLVAGGALDVASPAFSLFAFAELRDLLEQLHRVRLILPTANTADLGLLGSPADRAFRNRLLMLALARQCAQWIAKKAELRGTTTSIPQATIIATNPDHALDRVITGSCPFTTDGLGLTPGTQFSLIQCSEATNESTMLGSWFSYL